MDKFLEVLLANQALEVIKNKSDIQFYSFENQEIVKDITVDRYDMVKSILNMGISPITIVTSHLEPKPLISHVFSTTSDNTILKIFIDSLTEEHIAQLNQSTIKRLYSSINLPEMGDISTHFLRKIFELGFDFEQGTFNEVTQAIEGNIKFFELCLEFKENFKWDFKYSDRYLDEIVENNLKLPKFSTNYSSTLDGSQSLLIFLQQTRKIYSLKNTLENQLNEKVATEKKNKI